MDTKNSQRSERFDSYLDELADSIGHLDRHVPLKSYCLGLLLPGDRKSVEPLAALTDPLHVSAKHQSLLHFVGQAPWSDEALLRAVRRAVLPEMTLHSSLEAMVIDDTGMPKKGKHSVGVKNQYCGVLGKNANCQVAVSVSLANHEASLPAAYQLYLPEEWANDELRRQKAGVPKDIQFKTKWALALDLVDKLRFDCPDAAQLPVLADAGYGDAVGFRDGLTERGLLYAVGVAKNTVVWPPGQQPLPAKSKVAGTRGRPPKNLQRTADHKPVQALTLAKSLRDDAWQDVSWREGTQGEMTSRFTALRVRPSHGDTRSDTPRPEEWLLMEWPRDQAEPTKYWLSTLPANTPIATLVLVAKLRWRVERDYQELKDEIGLDHYEGRGWRGFHHHASLCIAAYGYLTADRCRLFSPDDGATPQQSKPSIPAGYRPRGAPHPG